MSNKKTIYIIGGTTEANRAARRLQDEGYRVVVSVATALGERVAADAGMETDTGRKDAAGMAGSAVNLGAAAIIDCSHPFARAASEQAHHAAAATELPYLRYTRPPVIPDDNAVAVESFEAAARKLRERGGRALLTVGTRHLETFIQAGIDFTARVLPMAESLEECALLGLDPKNIIAAWPPFSTDFNRACLRRSGADTLVTKDSGSEGGLDEKLAAAAAENAAVIIIRRPAEPAAIHDLEELVACLDSVLNCGISGHDAGELKAGGRRESRP
jgi:precorrin-6x reductase